MVIAMGFEPTSVYTDQKTSIMDLSIILLKTRYFMKLWLGWHYLLFISILYFHFYLRLLQAYPIFLIFQ